MNNLHAIIVKYVHQTSHKPGRISLRSGRHYISGHRKLIPWNMDIGTRLEDQAIEWLNDQGFTVLYTAELNEYESVVLVREFCDLNEDPAEWRANHC